LPQSFTNASHLLLTRIRMLGDDHRRLQSHAGQERQDVHLIGQTDDAVRSNFANRSSERAQASPIVPACMHRVAGRAHEAQTDPLDGSINTVLIGVLPVECNDRDAVAASRQQVGHTGGDSLGPAAVQRVNYQGEVSRHNVPSTSSIRNAAWGAGISNHTISVTRVRPHGATTERVGLENQILTY